MGALLSVSHFISPIELRVSIKAQARFQLSGLIITFAQNRKSLYPWTRLVNLPSSRCLGGHDELPQLVASMHADVFRSYHILSGIEIEHFTSSVSQTRIEPFSSEPPTNATAFNFNPSHRPYSSGSGARISFYIPASSAGL